MLVSVKYLNINGRIKDKTTTKKTRNKTILINFLTDSSANLFIKNNLKNSAIIETNILT